MVKNTKIADKKRSASSSATDANNKRVSRLGQLTQLDDASQDFLTWGPPIMHGVGEWTNGLWARCKAPAPAKLLPVPIWYLRFLATYIQTNGTGYQCLHLVSTNRKRGPCELCCFA